MKTKLLITIPLFISATLLGTSDPTGDIKPPGFPIRDQIVKRFDIDGDGHISVGEFVVVAKKLGIGDSLESRVACHISQHSYDLQSLVFFAAVFSLKSR